MAKYQIVMIRHGESEWNKLNKFCGWFDADLSEQGKVLNSNFNSKMPTFSVLAF